MLWPLSVVLVANTNGRLAIPALAGLLVTILVETTHAGKIMNPVHFEIDPADNRIRVNPDIRNPGSDFGLGGVCAVCSLLCVVLLNTGNSDDNL